jgi:hypothetical protein
LTLLSDYVNSPAF